MGGERICAWGAAASGGSGAVPRACPRKAPAPPLWVPPPRTARVWWECLLFLVPLHVVCIVFSVVSSDCLLFFFLLPSLSSTVGCGGRLVRLPTALVCGVGGSRWVALRTRLLIGARCLSSSSCPVKVSALSLVARCDLPNLLLPSVSSLTLAVLLRRRPRGRLPSLLGVL